MVHDCGRSKMRRVSVVGTLIVAGVAALAARQAARPVAPLAPAPAGEWRFIGGDAAQTRYSPLDQITAENFETLETAWLWRGDNFGPAVDYVSRSTPLYVDGVLYTVAGSRRTVVAIDPGTGETLWTYREPTTTRFDRGMRNNYGKGVAYGEIGGRRVVFYTSPAFFLHALDAKSGEHVENWGTPVPIPGFPRTGVVDMLPDLVRDWEPWLTAEKNYDAEKGIPRELGNLSTSSPPIVVNGVIVVGNVHEQGYYQTRIENIPGDILAYDVRSGKHLWKFHVIPRPGEFGHETWENDAWRKTGDVSSWAPMSADPARGLVYIPTNPPTIDFYGGFRPGDNLFGTSILALDVKTGKRGGTTRRCTTTSGTSITRPPPCCSMSSSTASPRRSRCRQPSRASPTRSTARPVNRCGRFPNVRWRPRICPGRSYRPRNRIPTRPKPLEIQELTEDVLIDFTPELRAEAIEIRKRYKTGPLFTPPIQVGHPSGLRSFVSCPAGASNINGPTTADPEAGVLYVATQRLCRAENLVPGEKMDEPDDPKTTGATLSRWVVANRGDLRGPDGLPIWKPPYSRIIAIDMHTGEFLWETPNGDTPRHIREHPRLQGLDIPPTGQMVHGVTMPTKTLLLTAPGGDAVLYALDKRTGQRLGTVRLPAPGQYGMMGYLHEGRQYVVVQIASGTVPGSLVALRLPAPASGVKH